MTVPALTPPVIRVFISSTFADMHQERDCFNTVLVPKLARMCSERGVSFFSIDLRWGITNEDQINGNVIPICLREIDLCRPYFIGILGNRYGSVMEDISDDMLEKIPWLEGKAGKSITELEMLYGVLSKEKNSIVPNCTFLMRTDRLSKEMYPDTEADGNEEKLSALKSSIREQSNISSKDYDSIEEFSEYILSSFGEWLDKTFPKTGNIREIRKNWFNKELLRDYVPVQSAENFLGKYLINSKRPLMLYGDAGRGKTTFLTNWQPQQGHKILINCSSDSYYTYWPSIVQDILQQINEIDKTYGYPNPQINASLFFKMFGKAADGDQKEEREGFSGNLYLVTDSERNSFRVSFIKWLEKLQIKEPIYIVINDLNVLSDTDSLYLSWLPVELPDGLSLICSTNNEEMTENAKMLGWNVKEMPTFTREEAEQFILRSLSHYGKKLTRNNIDDLLGSPLSGFPEQLKYIMQFLRTYIVYQELDTVISDIGKIDEIGKLYEYTVSRMIKTLTAEEKQVFIYTLTVLKCTGVSLKENECFSIVSEFIPLTAIEWANVRVVLDQLQLIHGEYWNMNQKHLCLFSSSLTDKETEKKIHAALGNYFYKQSKEMAPAARLSDRLDEIRYHTELSKIAVSHLRKSENWDLLSAVISDRKVLFWLSKLDWDEIRAAWMDILLFSDIDVENALLTIISEVQEKMHENQNNDKHVLLYKLASLFPDLELLQSIKKAQAIIGFHPISIFRTYTGKTSGDQFVELYQKLCTLKENRRIRQLAQESEKILNTFGNTFSHIERCYILSLKADAELILNQTDIVLDTCYQLHIEALRSGLVKEVLSSNLFRGQALYFSGRVDDAIPYLDVVIKYASRIGDIRSYLAALNVKGMCYYRKKDYDKSIKLLDICKNIWEKVGNIAETATIVLNQSNALFLKGDLPEAKEMILRICEKLESYPEDKTILSRYLSLKCNLGMIESCLKNYDQAEALLKQVLEHPCSGEKTLMNTYFNLIELYKRKREFFNLSDTSEKFMEMLEKSGRTYELYSVLNQAKELLVTAAYNRQASALYKKWASRLEKMPGGKELLKDHIKTSNSDIRSIENIKEQIAVAEAEDDKIKKAELLETLFEHVISNSVFEAVSYLIEAARLYPEKNEERKRCVEKALCILIEDKRITDKPLFEKALALADDSERQITDLWLSQVSLKEEKPDPQTNSKKALDIASMLQAFKKNHNLPASKEDLTSPKDEQKEHGEIFRRILAIVSADSSPLLRSECLCDYAPEICSEFSEKETQEFIEKLQTQPYCKKVIRALAHEYLKTATEDIEYLKQDFSSQKAISLIAFYEKAFIVLEHFEIEDAAAIAGNMALIFKRRREEEKTFRYHNISMQIYKKNGNIHDYLIEKSNYISSLSVFGHMNDAADYSRKAISEAKEAGEEMLEALIAGNLAAFLIESNKNGKHDEEILACFAVEETYFRKKREYRELVISLLNQIKFHFSNSGSTPDIVKKLSEAKKLIAEYRLTEFNKPVFLLERLISDRHNKPREDSSPANGNVQDILARITAGTDLEIVETTQNSGSNTTVVLAPAKINPMAKTNIILSLSCSEPFDLKAMFAMKPLLNIPGGENNDVFEYIEWWNTQHMYFIIYDQKDGVFLANANLTENNIETSAKRFGTFSALWEIDSLIITMLLLGIADIEKAKEIKLKAIKQE